MSWLTELFRSGTARKLTREVVDRKVQATKNDFIADALSLGLSLPASEDLWKRTSKRVVDKLT